MEPETNNEIDLLLRRMARGNGVARDGVQNDDQHLDADELSSYAQNALPAAARARYTEHLAECATCRRLITELSLSLGSAVVAAPVETAAEPSGWKKFFASLLSPMVLRYAVPALGVIVVMVVGFVILRRQGQSEFMVKLDESRATSTSTPPTDAPAGNSVLHDSAEKETDKVKTQNATPRAGLDAQPSVAQERPAGAVGAAPAAAAPATEDKLAAAEPPPTATPEPSPTVAAKAAPAAEAQTETAIVTRKQPETAKEKEETETRNANEQPRDQAAAKQSDDKTEQHQAAAPTATAGYSGLRGLAARRAEATKPGSSAKTGQADKDANTSTADEATRTVAGRHFRKQGNAWIDTAYESSTATVNMARNSEQFRALVADEPAIGTIARQLDGEVIVVWKGHAYRIR